MSRRSEAFDHAALGNDSSTDERFSASEAPTWAEDKNPTRPLPMFRLEEEARRLNQEAAAAAAAAAAVAGMRCDEDATVTVSAEDNMRLLASVFPAQARTAADDEPTLDAPAPTSPEAIARMAMPRPVRVTARPPALTRLVITRPAPISTPRPSVVPAAVVSPAEVPASSSNALPPVAVAAPPVARALAFAPPTATPEPMPAVLVPPQSGFRPRITPELVAAARALRDAEDARRSAVTFAIPMQKRRMQTYLVAGIWAMALSLFALLFLMTTSA